MVVADTTGGPVVIGEGAVVTAFTRLEGPCAIGADTHLLGAKVRGGTTIGPHCRVGGEVECSVVLGYANKYHDGFLGHSYVGEWVNLAAGTSTGDLRCDYRPVRVPVDGAEVSTGRTKVGSVIGDHAKTGLGVLLNCGTALGCFAQVLPTGTLAPRAVPSFHRAGPPGLKVLSANRCSKPLTSRCAAAARAHAATRSDVSALAGAPAVEAPVTLPLRKSARRACAKRPGKTQGGPRRPKMATWPPWVFTGILALFRPNPAKVANSTHPRPVSRSTTQHPRTCACFGSRQWASMSSLSQPAS